MEQSTLFLEDFLASLSVWPGSEKARKITATYGRKCSELYRKQGPLGLLVKMLLESLTWHSKVCFLTWKVSGMKPNVLLFQLVPWMPRTDEIEFGLLPTPVATLAHSGFSIGTAKKVRQKIFKRKSGARIGSSLKWHPILIKDYENGKGTYPSPVWLEYLMGYPKNWTELNHLETQ